MGCELDQLMWAAWARVRDKVLGDQAELHRRLRRREKTFDAVPRALCFALRAGDRRINEMNAWLSVRHAMDKGHEVEHQVQITSQLVRDLCRPVEPYWGQGFPELARALGCDKNLPRKLERKGVFPARRIKGLGGQRGKPVPLIDSRIPAAATKEQRDRYAPLLLDPGIYAHSAPLELLRPYWQSMPARLPDGIEQILTRKPKRRAGSSRLMGWVWSCPGCGQNAQTIYLPAGGPDWAAAHHIKLPNVPWFQPPSQPRCFACHRCHHLYRISLATPRSMMVSWSHLIAHLSGGLLYGKEVQRPDSLAIVRRYAAARRRKRASPTRDEIEQYLVYTDLTAAEIARRMGWTRGSVHAQSTQIYRLRRISGRKALKRWWAKHQPVKTRVVAAA